MIRILIVDDSRMQSKIYEGYLRDRFQCEVAPDGIDAVMLFKTAMQEKNYFLFCIMDMSMQVMNGAEAVEKIRKLEGLNPDAPKSYIILATSMTDHEMADETALNSDLVDIVLRKPITRDQLLDTIQNAIRERAGA